ncbi:hypothetical protein [Pseudomonas reinekei]|jgi:hypothetical protein
MSLRQYQKSHSGGAQSLHDNDMHHFQVPDSSDPLQFWSRHAFDDRFIDLNVFANGLSGTSRPGSKNHPFTGRPELIRELAPAIKSICLGLSRSCIIDITACLRTWWRLFDSFDKFQEAHGLKTYKICSVKDINILHCKFAHEHGMRTCSFTRFLTIVNATLVNINESRLYWPSPEDPPVERHLPPEEQITTLRIELKQAWQAVRQRWNHLDSLRETADDAASNNRNCLYEDMFCLAKAQSLFYVLIPTNDQFNKVFPGISSKRCRNIRSTAFPDAWEVSTAFHMVLANTGWNPAVLLGLDASDERAFIRDHPQDSSRYILNGIKARAGNAHQPVIGLWKTTWGPGPILRLLLLRTAPLRAIVFARLKVERQRAALMQKSQVSYDKLISQKKLITRLEQGCRSAWLYVNQVGVVSWLNDWALAIRDGKVGVGYMTLLVRQINEKRRKSGLNLLAEIKASDFRDIFATYVWRQSGGNILAVMRALNHRSLNTTEVYCDNTILNRSRDKEARKFVKNLFEQLDTERFDVTILAHLQRYGSVTPDMECRLDSYRKLQVSRIKIACLDPMQPPSEFEAKYSETSMCSSQRCLLCAKNAVILPESLDGIAMRIEELNFIKCNLSLEVWASSRYEQELLNARVALKLFSSEEVGRRCSHWAQKIDEGSHRVPGFPLLIDLVSRNEDDEVK